MSELRETNKRQHLWLFFLLAFAFSWTCWIVVVAISVATDGFLVLEPIIYLGVLGPLLSAVVVSRAEIGKMGVKNLLQSTTRWVSKGWILLSLLLPISLFLGSLGISILLGFNFPLLSISTWFNVIVLFLYSVLLSGGLEEPGWRGYALPALENKYSSSVSSSILGTAWALWHLPLYFIPDYASTGGSFIGLFLMAIPMAFLYTWTYNKTQSVFICILMHSSMNFIGDVFLIPLDDQIFGIVYLLLLWMMTLILAIVFRREYNSLT